MAYVFAPKLHFKSRTVVFYLSYYLLCRQHLIPTLAGPRYSMVVTCIHISINLLMRFYLSTGRFTRSGVGTVYCVKREEPVS